MPSLNLYILKILHFASVIGGGGGGGGAFFFPPFVGRGRGYFCQPGYGALDLKATCFKKKKN